MYRFKKNKIIIIGNIVLLIVCLFIYSSRTLQTVDSWLQDYQFKNTASHQPNENIVVIAIDNNSIEQLGQFPWDRSIYSSFLDQINIAGYEPHAIAFDVIFSEASNEESDQIFTDALARYDNVILPVYADLSGAIFTNFSNKRDEPVQADNIVKPYAPFAEVSHLAHINRTTTHDGVIRQVWVKITDLQGQEYPTLAYKALSLSHIDLSDYDNITDIQKTSDVLPKHTITIDYNLVTDDITTVSFVDVLNGEIPAESELFKDAYVFVGFTATGIGNEAGLDSGQTPLERNSKLVYVHANIANQLLNHTLISYLPNLVEVLILIAFFILFCWLPWRFKTLYTFMYVVIAIVGLFLIQSLLFATYNIFVYLSSTVVALIIAYLFNLSLKAYREQQMKSFVTRQFGRYISPDLVKQIISTGMDLQLGGVSKEVTVLFLDIRGFTSLSEKLTPAEVVDILNTKFTMITNTVLQFNGSIDKFIGDAAMILFNAPLDVAEHEKQAVLTAYHIQKNMLPIQEEIRKKYDVEVAIGIGIHTGPVVIGNIGSYLRMDYTAIGDTVNTASRIESGTRAGQMLVSEDIYLKTKHFVNYAEPEEKLFKGKSKPMKIYEIISLKEG